MFKMIFLAYGDPWFQCKTPELAWSIKDCQLGIASYYFLGGGSGCVTVDGDDVGAPCIFPFIYKDKTYNGCGRYKGQSDDEPAWCATSVDSQGILWSWGHCEEKCPKDLG